MDTIPSQASGLVFLGKPYVYVSTINDEAGITNYQYLSSDPYYFSCNTSKTINNDNASGSTATSITLTIEQLSIAFVCGQMFDGDLYAARSTKVNANYDGIYFASGTIASMAILSTYNNVTSSFYDTKLHDVTSGIVLQNISQYSTRYDTYPVKLFYLPNKYPNKYPNENSNILNYEYRKIINYNNATENNTNNKTTIFSHYLGKILISESEKCAYKYIGTTNKKSKKSTFNATETDYINFYNYFTRNYPYSLLSTRIDANAELHNFYGLSGTQTDATIPASEKLTDLQTAYLLSQSITNYKNYIGNFSTSGNFVTYYKDNQWTTVNPYIQCDTGSVLTFTPSANGVFYFGSAYSSTLPPAPSASNGVPKIASNSRVIKLFKTNGNIDVNELSGLTPTDSIVSTWVMKKIAVNANQTYMLSSYIENSGDANQFTTDHVITMYIPD